MNWDNKKTYGKVEANSTTRLSERKKSVTPTSILWDQEEEEEDRQHDFHLCMLPSIIIYPKILLQM